MLQQKLPQQEQGFTLAEVLIAILIASLFVAAAMQAMVFATVFKVRAQEYAEATTWIQQDLENVKFQASQYNKDPVSGIANDTLPDRIHSRRCSATTPETGYADGLSDRLSGRLETLIINTGAGTDTADSPQTSRFGKAYRLRRTITPVNNAPFNVLRVNYNVVLASDSSTNPCPAGAIACIYTEVIPDAAFQCP